MQKGDGRGELNTVHRMHLHDQNYHRVGSWYEILHNTKEYLKISNMVTYKPHLQVCFHDQQDSQWHNKSIEPESCQVAKIHFLLLSSDGLVQCCVNLLQQF